MSFYLSLALFVAVALNARSGWWRSLGTLAAAVALAFMAWSIWLANGDGTFAALAPGARWRAWLLNGQAVVAGVAVLCLLGAAVVQVRREVGPVAVRNDGAGFGLASRYAHWATAVMVLAALPMGVFVAVLAEGPVRAEFAAIHRGLGIAVLAVVIARLGWLVVSPPPSTSVAARAVQALLYALMLVLAASGLLLDRGAPWPAVHSAALPVILLALAAHIGAAAINHRRDRQAVRRMLR